MTDWQPIETAPKDGTGVIIAASLWRTDQVGVGEAYYYDGGPADSDTGWWWAGTSPGEYADESLSVSATVPTHWMPLPPPPSAEPQ